MCASVSAQTVTGRVSDASTSGPVPGATVSVEGTARGVAAGADGRYRLALAAPGMAVLVVRAVGYEPARHPVTAGAADTLRLDVALTPAVVGLGAVEVVADRLREAERTAPSVVAVTPEAARALPGAAEDVLRALQATPGVLATSDFTAQLVVRGGGPDQNLILLDGVEVFNPYRLYGVTSMFNPAVVEDVRLLTGGFGARYGDRLSSVLDVRMRPGTTERPFGGSLNASVVSGSLVLEGSAPGGGSWLLTGRRTYYDLLLGLFARRFEVVEPGTTFPNFADLQGKLILRPAAGHRLQLGAIASRDVLDLALDGRAGGDDLDRLDAADRTRNDVAYATWQWAPTPRLLSTLTASWYRNGGTFGSDGRLVPRDNFFNGRFVASQDTVNVFEFAYDQTFRFRKWSLGQQTTWQRGRHLLEAGAGADVLHTALRFDLALNDVGRAYFETLQQDNPLGPGALPDAFDHARTYGRAHLYLQDRIETLGGRLFVRPGLRLDYYGLLGAAYVSPRLSLSYRTGAQTTLRAAWGRYRQSPGFEKLLDEGQLFDLSAEAALDALGAERATHAVAGISRWLGERVEVRAEAYAKGFDDLIVQARDTVARTVAQYVGGPHTSPRSYRLTEERTLWLTPAPTGDAQGRAYGVEFVVAKRQARPEDRVSGWASYAYARATRSRPPGTGTGALVRTPFDYDRRHVATAVLEARLGRAWSVGATFRYGTGFPYTPAVGYRPIVVTSIDPRRPDDRQARILTNAVTGQVRFETDYGDERNVNAARLPAYHRLDVRVARQVRAFGLDGQLYLDVINAYNRTNVVAYRYVIAVARDGGAPTIRRERVGMLPLVPTLGVRLSW